MHINNYLKNIEKHHTDDAHRQWDDIFVTRTALRVLGQFVQLGSPMWSFEHNAGSTEKGGDSVQTPTLFSKGHKSPQQISLK